MIRKIIRENFLFILLYDKIKTKQTKHNKTKHNKTKQNKTKQN